MQRGYDPDLPLVVRAENRNYDSFKPVTIGEAAKWTVSEENKGGPGRRRDATKWTVGEADKSGPSLRRWMPLSHFGKRPSDR